MTKALAITAGVLDALNLVISAWRYVLSATYRAQVQAHWQQTTESRKAAEMIGAVFCLAATQNAIAAFFTRAGFERLLSEAWYRAAVNVAIFDTWHHECVGVCWQAISHRYCAAAAK